LRPLRRAAVVAIALTAAPVALGASELPDLPDDPLPSVEVGPPVEDAPPAEAAPAAADDDSDADTKPLWEIGMVAGGGYLPDYPAADQNHFRGIVLPYAVYRGDFFRVGDRGVARGIFADTDRFELDVGIDAAFPVDSNDNDAREGMDDLDYLLEVGPRLTYYFLPPSHRDDFYVSLATRAVISTDFANWRYQGITVAPRLTYWRNRILDRDFNLAVWVEPLFGFDGLNDYFYEVRPGDARSDRPAYEADDGYIGTELSFGFSYGFSERLRAFGGVQIGYWNHSANDDSPLHRDDTTVGVGGGLRWSIFVSEERVER
jgi:outer membrane scaffolding protein for murein synthesis (MipA/OmpV family)